MLSLEEQELLFLQKITERKKMSQPANGYFDTQFNNWQKIHYVKKRI